MTAINIIVGRERVDVITDGATYDQQGVMLGHAAKVVMFAHLPAVLAARGPTFLLPLLSARLWDAFRSFDELAEEIVERVQASVRIDAEAFAASPHGPNFDLYIAGFSERLGRAQAFAISTRPNHGGEAWQLVEITDGAVSPADSAFAERVTELELDLSPEAFDAARDGLALLREQRARPWGFADSDATACIVGAFGQCTTVRRDGIASRIIERWPDRVGQRIEPAVHPALPAVA